MNDQNLGGHVILTEDRGDQYLDLLDASEIQNLDTIEAPQNGKESKAKVGKHLRKEYQALFMTHQGDDSFDQ